MIRSDLGSAARALSMMGSAHSGHSAQHGSRIRAQLLRMQAFARHKLAHMVTPMLSPTRLGGDERGAALSPMSRTATRRCVFARSSQGWLRHRTRTPACREAESTGVDVDKTLLLTPDALALAASFDWGEACGGERSQHAASNFAYPEGEPALRPLVDVAACPTPARLEADADVGLAGFHSTREER